MGASFPARGAGLVLMAIAAAPAWSVPQPQRPHALAEGEKLIREGKPRDAETLARQRLPEVEARYGPESIEVAQVLDVLTQALIRGGRAKGPEPVALIKRAIAIKEKQAGAEHPDVAASLMILGRLHDNAADLKAARETYQRALDMRVKALGPDHPDVAKSLSNLAGTLGDMGANQEARGMYQQALAILAKALPPDHEDVAPVLNNFASVLARDGEHALARSSYERALALHEKNHGLRHPLVGGTANNLAGLLWNMGDLAAARPLLERSLSILEERLGSEHPDIASPLNNLAIVLGDMGDLAGARAHNERALGLRRKAFGDEHPEVATSMANLGVLLGEAGDFQEGRSLLERALAIREAALGPVHPDVATNLQALGDRLVATGEYQAARPYFDRALAMRRTLFGESGLAVAGTLNSLAELLTNVGDYHGARVRFEEVLSILGKSVGSDHPNVADALSGFGRMLAAAGDYPAARSALERSLKIREASFGPAHPAVANSLADLAGVLARTGERVAALSAGLRAEEAGRNHLRLTARAQSERQALAYAAVRPSGLGVALSLAADDPAGVPLESVWDALVRSRAVVLDEMAARHRSVYDGQDPEIARLAVQLAAVRQRLVNLTVRGAGRDPAGHRKLLDATAAEREQAEEALAQHSAPFRTAQARERQGFAEVASALPAGAGLVAFVRYQQPGPVRLPAGSAPNGPPAWYLGLVLAGSRARPVAVPLGAAADIEDLVASWRTEVVAGDTAASRAARAELSYRRAGLKLRQKVWDPLAPHLGRAPRVFVVPDGALNLVNFAALPSGRDRYLVQDGPLFHYLSTERDLTTPAWPGAGAGGLLALGDPAFDEPSLFESLAAAARTPGAPERAAASAASPPAPGRLRGRRSACGGFEAMRFDSLPASGREVAGVASLWEDGASIEARSPGPAEVLTGAAASESAFKEKARSHRVLHVATHGFFLGERCSGQGPGGPKAAAENPLLLAGLALAGANRRSAASPHEDDGILTAEEIAVLDLGRVEWAILSACGTGLGEVRAGEGVLGLRRAFQVAGAGTLVMSLWPVDDESTRRWMEALYSHRFLKRLSTAEAVSEASLSVLRGRRQKRESTHPFFWAGFLAAGNWR